LTNLLLQGRVIIGKVAMLLARLTRYQVKTGNKMSVVLCALIVKHIRLF